MSRIGIAVGAALLAATLAVSAQAQSNEPSTTDKVKHWSQKQWKAAKAEWSKDKNKWDMCNARSDERHLKGRASWSFIYDCMKS